MIFLIKVFIFTCSLISTDILNSKSLKIVVDDFLLPKVRNDYLELSHNPHFRPVVMMDVFSAPDFSLYVNIINKNDSNESVALIEIPIDGWEEGKVSSIQKIETILSGELTKAINRLSVPLDSLILRFIFVEEGVLSASYLDHVDLHIKTLLGAPTSVQRIRLRAYRLSNLTKMLSEEVILNISVNLTE